MTGEKQDQRSFLRDLSLTSRIHFSNLSEYSWLLAPFRDKTSESRTPLPFFFNAFVKHSLAVSAAVFDQIGEGRRLRRLRRRSAGKACK
jgi:hypothetical protein